jgi:hypothetical protein
VWQWWRYATSRVHGDKPVLAVNLDETAVLLHHPGQKGLVWLPKTKGRIRRRVKPIQKLSHGAKRQCLTHVAMISNLPEVTKKLPQILLGNEHVIPASAVPELQACLDPSIKIWRRKSSWVNACVMKEIARELSKSLSEYKETHRIVLLLDCCPAHVDPGYITMLGNQGIGVVFVPALLTWLLQPLDTHAFSAYKVAVSERYRRFLMDAQECQVSNLECLKLIGQTISEHLQKKDWSKAFAGNNFGGRSDAPEDVRRAILEVLEWEYAPVLPSTLPTLEQFAYIFPRNRDAPLHALLKLFRGSPPVVPLPKKKVPVEPLAAGQALNPWLGRLRSSSSLQTLPQPFTLEPEDTGSASIASSSSTPWPMNP